MSLVSHSMRACAISHPHILLRIMVASCRQIQTSSYSTRIGQNTSSSRVKRGGSGSSGAYDTNTSTIIDELDTPRSNILMSPKKKNKLSLGLQKLSTESPSSTAMEGVLEGMAEDVCGVLNDSLASTKLFRLFRGCNDTSEAIEIELVKLNKDCSHVTAYWDSKLTSKFYQLLSLEEGDVQASALISKVHSSIASRLQSKESVFRKKMDFRRVPRIFFIHVSDRNK
jgi:hypothetical protein